MKRLFAGDSMLGPLAMPMHRCILDAPRGDANGTQSPVMELHPSSPSVLRRGSVAFSPVGRSPDFVASRRDADATSQMQDDGGEVSFLVPLKSILRKTYTLCPLEFWAIARIKLKILFLAIPACRCRSAYTGVSSQMARTFSAQC